MTQQQTKIESLLFVANKPLSAKQLAKILSIEEESVTADLAEIQAAHRETGIVLMEASGVWQFGTEPKNSPEIKSFLNLELREKLTEATVETLAIIAYRQPISRAEIEAIRGVNCQYSLRHLLIRGMIEKISNPKDSRQLLYQTTIEFLQHLGLSSANDLPDFEKLVTQIQLPELPSHAEDNGESEESAATN